METLGSDPERGLAPPPPNASRSPALAHPRHTLSPTLDGSAARLSGMSRLRFLAPLLAAVVIPAAAMVLAHRLDAAPPPSTGTVVRVVDGDTVYVRAGSRSFDVRLLGIDT